eukprot:8195250-Heterocapsa_arctica.AAC.1
MFAAERPRTTAWDWVSPVMGPGCSASPIRRARSPYLAAVLGELPVCSLRLRLCLVCFLRLRGLLTGGNHLALPSSLSYSASLWGWLVVVAA